MSKILALVVLSILGKDDVSLLQFSDDPDCTTFEDKSFLQICQAVLDDGHVTAQKCLVKKMNKIAVQARQGNEKRLEYYNKFTDVVQADKAAAPGRISTFDKAFDTACPKNVEKFFVGDSPFTPGDEHEEAMLRLVWQAGDSSEENCRRWGATFMEVVRDYPDDDEPCDGTCYYPDDEQFNVKRLTPDAQFYCYMSKFKIVINQGFNFNNVEKNCVAYKKDQKKINQQTPHHCGLLWKHAEAWAHSYRENPRDLGLESSACNEMQDKEYFTCNVIARNSVWNKQMNKYLPEADQIIHWDNYIVKCNEVLDWSTGTVTYTAMKRQLSSQECCQPQKITKGPATLKCLKKNAGKFVSEECTVDDEPNPQPYQDIVGPTGFRKKPCT